MKEERVGREFYPFKHVVTWGLLPFNIEDNPRFEHSRLAAEEAMKGAIANLKPDVREKMWRYLWQRKTHHVGVVLMSPRTGTNVQGRSQWVGNGLILYVSDPPGERLEERYAPIEFLLLVLLAEAVFVPAFGLVDIPPQIEHPNDWWSVVTQFMGTRITISFKE